MSSRNRSTSGSTSAPRFPSPRSHLRKQADGFTYERSAIELWFENHNTSPATGLELESKQLKPNHSLRSLIRDLS